MIKPMHPNLMHTPPSSRNPESSRIVLMKFVKFPQTLSPGRSHRQEPTAQGGQEHSTWGGMGDRTLAGGWVFGLSSQLSDLTLAD